MGAVQANMSQVDLESNKAQLSEARDKVLSDTGGNMFALFHYADSGNSNTLMVDTVGDEGLEGLLEELNSTRVQYGLVSVKQESRTKSVLVIWQGEGTPILRKSVCAHHEPDITRFLKPSATYIARSDEDLDPDAIRALLANQKLDPDAIQALF